MDLHGAIKDLQAEKEKMEQAIASIEELQRAGGSPRPASGSRLEAPRTQVHESR